MFYPLKCAVSSLLFAKKKSIMNPCCDRIKICRLNEQKKNKLVSLVKFFFFKYYLQQSLFLRFHLYIISVAIFNQNEVLTKKIFLKHFTNYANECQIGINTSFPRLMEPRRCFRHAKHSIGCYLQLQYIVSRLHA